MPREKHQETDPDGLTSRQRVFVEVYSLTLNATEAHRRAGYRCKESNREASASEILRSPKVQAALKKLKQARAERTEITAERVIRELANIAFANSKDYSSWGTHTETLDTPQGPQQVTAGNWLKLQPSDTLTPDQTAAIKGVKHTVKTGKTSEDTLELSFHDKVMALRLLGEHLGVFDKRKGGADEFKEWLEKLDRL